MPGQKFWISVHVHLISQKLFGIQTRIEELSITFKTNTQKDTATIEWFPGNSDLDKGDPDKKQPDLPKLPIPDLEKTIQRYLEAVHPILTPTQYEHVQKLAEEFLENEGPQIQHQLEDRRLRQKNWAVDWWLHDMYMNNPLCLPINSNPGGVWPAQTFTSEEEQLQFAAKLTSFMLDFKDKLDRNEIPVEKAANREPGQPLCMAQHYRLMSTYRLPGIVKDVQRDTSTSLVDHIIVAYRKHFFSCPIRTVNRRLTSSEIQNQFKAILDLESVDSEDPVGILTSQDRRVWGKARTILLEEDVNKQSLEEIETCHFIVCLDQPLPAAQFNSKLKSEGKNCLKIPQNGRDETSMLHQMIHGGGSLHNTANRWFDKTMQFIVSADGAIGLCYEHSTAEGIGILNLVDEFVQTTNSSAPPSPSPLSAPSAEVSPPESPSKSLPDEISKPIRLEWILSSEAKEAVAKASTTIDRLVYDLDLAVYRYETYGKNFIKKCQVSPDVYVQLALQLTYYSLHQNMVATYESASTRRYKLGRVDCIRSTTIEALEWVKSMSPGVTPSDSNEQIRKFHAAVEKQTTIMVENIMGEGIDIHLLGLREQAMEMGIEVPKLLVDETFAIANYFALSTSQLPTKENQFMGYGPVVPNGYGASYNPKEESIIFCISSFTSSTITSTLKFTRALQQSLDTMKQLLQQ